MKVPPEYLEVRAHSVGEEPGKSTSVPAPSLVKLPAPVMTHESVARRRCDVDFQALVFAAGLGRLIGNDDPTSGITVVLNSDVSGQNLNLAGLYVRRNRNRIRPTGVENGHVILRYVVRRGSGIVARPRDCRIRRRVVPVEAAVVPRRGAGGRFPVKQYRRGCGNTVQLSLRS